VAYNSWILAMCFVTVVSFASKSRHSKARCLYSKHRERTSCIRMGIESTKVSYDLARLYASFGRDDRSTLLILPWMHFCYLSSL